MNLVKIARIIGTVFSGIVEIFIQPSEAGEVVSGGSFVLKLIGAID